MKPVTVYTKSYCSYSARAKDLLRNKGVRYDEIDVTDEDDRFSEMTERSRGRTTTPQVFIDGEHVGGLRDLEKLDQQGDLDQKLQ